MVVSISLTHRLRAGPRVQKPDGMKDINFRKKVVARGQGEEEADAISENMGVRNYDKAQQIIINIFTQFKLCVN